MFLDVSNRACLSQQLYLIQLYVWQLNIFLFQNFQVDLKGKHP
ncbi:unnamed protein product [Paramecium octaurelia]|uniref:Uncharacterized protein n=1 Tax=Paramecium octaurelia TaxID=43137 RepID=A0A8S1W5J6_PAROT|nr:unnamed protein product [Paramecium octaurelia]